MEFTSFKAIVRDEVERRTGNECFVRLTDIIKNNGVKLRGLTVTQGEGNISPTIYLDAYYEAYENGRADLKEIVSEIISVYKSNKPACNIDMEYFLNYEAVRKRIVYKLINTEKNRELLGDIPHIEFHDLSIVFQFLLESDCFGSATILIHNAHMKIWGITLNEIYNDAKRNTPILNRYEIKSMGDVISEIMPAQDSAHNDVPLYVLSNKSRLQGAACMLYPDLLKNFSAAVDSSLYIIPSSIHEVLLLPTDENDDAENIKQMIKEVNDTQVEEEEVLSYSVYFYDNADDRIYKC